MQVSWYAMHLPAVDHLAEVRLGEQLMPTLGDPVPEDRTGWQPAPLLHGGVSNGAEEEDEGSCAHEADAARKWR